MRGRYALLGRLEGKDANCILRLVDKFVIAEEQEAEHLGAVRSWLSQMTLAEAQGESQPALQ